MSCTRCYGFKFSERHAFLDVTVKINFIAFGQGYNRFFAVYVAAAKNTCFGKAGFGFATVVHGVDFLNFNAIHFFYRLFDFQLVGTWLNNKTVTIQLIALSRHFFGYKWLNQLCTHC